MSFSGDLEGLDLSTSKLSKVPVWTKVFTCCEWPDQVMASGWALCYPPFFFFFVGIIVFWGDGVEGSKWSWQVFNEQVFSQKKSIGDHKMQNSFELEPYLFQIKSVEVENYCIWMCNFLNGHFLFFWEEMNRSKTCIIFALNSFSLKPQHLAVSILGRRSAAFFFLKDLNLTNQWYFK